MIDRIGVHQMCFILGKLIPNAMINIKGLMAKSMKYCQLQATWLLVVCRIEFGENTDPLNFEFSHSFLYCYDREKGTILKENRNQMRIDIEGHL